MDTELKQEERIDTANEIERMRCAMLEAIKTLEHDGDEFGVAYDLRKALKGGVITRTNVWSIQAHQRCAVSPAPTFELGEMKP